jgi:anti-anti-sigma regulatory factor
MSTSATELVLTERLEMAEARSLHARLLEALTANAPVVIDASAVATIDTASAQALVAFSLSAKERGLSITWRRSPVFDAFFTLTALNAALASP